MKTEHILIAQKQLEADNALAQQIINRAIEIYGPNLVVAALNLAPYYIIPDTMIFMTCPICESQITIDYIERHIHNHRGIYECIWCSRRFKTERGRQLHDARSHRDMYRQMYHDMSYK